MTNRAAHKPWHRNLWGIEFVSRGCKPVLIGGLWSESIRERACYQGEPTRVLLFQTRKDARAWIKAYDRYPSEMRVARVRETVKVI